MKKLLIIILLGAIFSCKGNNKTVHNDEQTLDELENVVLDESTIKAMLASPGYLDQLLENADHGNADAQYFIATCYYNGWELPQDYENAVMWFTKAAELGHPKAQFSLATCYQYGTGLQQDYDKAFYWYKQSALQEDADALSRLGECYLNGFGVICDEEKAIKLFQESASQGSSEGIGNLGQAYYWGMGVEKDLKKAISLMEEATQQGQDVYYGLLGNAYYQLGDYDKAVYNLQFAAEQGDGRAQLLLGDCYLYGIGVEENESIAKMWYNKAAEQGETYSPATVELEELEE